MLVRMSHARVLPRSAIVTALLTLGIGLSGCAGGVSDVGDSLALGFVDPARYDFYDCKQLEAERKAIASHIQDTKKLMAKADTGFAGPVVAEIAYRNDYVAELGQAKLADRIWKRNNCRETPPDPLGAAAAPPPGHAKGSHGPSRAGNAVY